MFEMSFWSEAQFVQHVFWSCCLLVQSPFSGSFVACSVARYFSSFCVWTWRCRITRWIREQKISVCALCVRENSTFENNLWCISHIPKDTMILLCFCAQSLRHCVSFEAETSCCQWKCSTGAVRFRKNMNTIFYWPWNLASFCSHKTVLHWPSSSTHWLAHKTKHTFIAVPVVIFVADLQTSFQWLLFMRIYLYFTIFMCTNLYVHCLQLEFSTDRSTSLPLRLLSDFSHERVNPFQFRTYRLSLLLIERSISIRSINQLNRLLAQPFLQDILEALSGLVSCLRGSDEHERQDFLPPRTRVSSTFSCGRMDRLHWLQGDIQATGVTRVTKGQWVNNKHWSQTRKQIWAERLLDKLVTAPRAVVRREARRCTALWRHFMTTFQLEPESEQKVCTVFVYVRDIIVADTKDFQVLFLFASYITFATHLT